MSRMRHPFSWGFPGCHSKQVSPFSQSMKKAFLLAITAGDCSRISFGLPSPTHRGYLLLAPLIPYFPVVSIPLWILPPRLSLGRAHLNV